MTSRELLVLADPASFRRWHVWLAAEIAARLGRAIAFRASASDAREPLPAGVALLSTLEGMIYGLGGGHAFDPVALEADGATLRPAGPGEAFDIALDLRGGGAPVPGIARVVAPLFDGIAGHAGAVARALDGVAPRLSLAVSDGTAIDLGLPAVEEPRVLVSALDNILSRMAVAAGAVIARALQAGAIGEGTDAGPRLARFALTGRAEPRPEHGPARFLAAGLASKLNARLQRLLGIAPHWHLAWRRLPEVPGIRPPPRELSRADYDWIRDDGQRYFGDPFGYVHEGELHVFCEEFPFATGKGVISTFKIGADGRAGPTRVVLERPHHLSYPQVFARDGHIWMLPEASGGKTLELFRAVRFPDQWELAARLVEGEYHDATFHAGPDRLWILANQSSHRSSTWDALSILSADALLGPWTGHPGNPVIVDAGAARPAGELRTIAGQLWRPAQVCTSGYGRALAWCRVDALTPDRFAQTVVATAVFCPSQNTSGPHTWNEAGGIELIDFLGPRLASAAG